VFQVSRRPFKRPQTRGLLHAGLFFRSHKDDGLLKFLENGDLYSKFVGVVLGCAALFSDIQNLYTSFGGIFSTDNIDPDLVWLKVLEGDLSGAVEYSLAGLGYIVDIFTLDCENRSFLLSTNLRSQIFFLMLLLWYVLWFFLSKFSMFLSDIIQTRGTVSS